MTKHHYIFIVPDTQYKKRWEFFPFMESSSRNDVIIIENQAVIDILLYATTENTEQHEQNRPIHGLTPRERHLVRALSSCRETTGIIIICC
jgi:hypothetical protein